MASERGRWVAVEGLFWAALAKPAEGRGAFLAEACAGDEALRREVESLLARNASSRDFRELLPNVDEILEVGELDGAEPGRLPEAGFSLGRYLIDRELGRGGMGVVFLGHDPTLQRQIAIKVLPSGCDDGFSSLMSCSGSRSTGERLPAG
jgi:eukaryotic-like serine/threonine-protein kinase